MTEHYQQIWTGITNAIEETQAIQALAGVVVEKEGRGFISRLDSKDAVSCVRILDRVSNGSNSPPSHSDGLVRALQVTLSDPPRSKHSSLP